jgi:hypothetical protein
MQWMPAMAKELGIGIYKAFAFSPYWEEPDVLAALLA